MLVWTLLAGCELLEKEECDPADMRDWVRDEDGDGYGVEVEGCYDPTLEAQHLGDCDDQDPWVFPRAYERCNEEDDDCDGLIDEVEDLLQGEVLEHPDRDRDAYGDPSELACASWETTPNDRDCNDQDYRVNPGEDELCDQIDNDCDERIDEDARDTTFVWADRDGDGYTRQYEACPYHDQPALPVGDCDDDAPDVHPDAPDACDGIDHDCNGLLDGPESIDAELLWFDEDDDGYGSGEPQLMCPGLERVSVGGDCDDIDDAVFPGAIETCNDVDDDCDGAVDSPTGVAREFYPDQDGDGYGPSEALLLSCSTPAGHVLLSGDCDDAAAEISPLAEETCDGLDNDCDGRVDPPDSTGVLLWSFDEDLDGWGAGLQVSGCEPPPSYAPPGDCDDALPEVSPDGHELCINGLDEDCDGSADDYCDLQSVGATILTGELHVDGVATGDLNADGYEDLVVDSMDALVVTIRVLFGPFSGERQLLDADWTFERPLSPRDPNWISQEHRPAQTALRVADLDGDGFDDLAVGAHDLGFVTPADPSDPAQIAAAWAATPGGAHWFAGPLQPGVVSAGDAAGSVRGEPGDQAGQQLVAGDLDGDGLTELVMGTGGSSAARIVTGLAPGLYDLPPTWEIEGDTFMRLHDADGDGQLDLWVVEGGSFYLYPGPIDGDRDTSMARTSLSPSLPVTDLLLTDLDADGDEDMLFCSNFFAVIGALNLVTAPVPAGAIGYTPIVSESYAPETLLPVRDLDGDGVDDVLIHTYYDSGAQILSGTALSSASALDGTVLLELSSPALGTIDPLGDGVRQPVVYDEGLLGIYDL